MRALTRAICAAAILLLCVPAQTMAQGGESGEAAVKAATTQKLLPSLKSVYIKRKPGGECVMKNSKILMPLHNIMEQYKRDQIEDPIEVSIMLRYDLEVR